MSEAKHTPGDWMIPFNGDGTTVMAFFAAGDGSWVQTVAVADGATIGEKIANARLIAAAPDLLTAAMLVHERIMRNGVLVASNIEELLDVIKKALGLEKLPTRKAKGDDQ